MLCLLGPTLPETYSDKVSDLVSQLQHPDEIQDAKDALCGLVHRIVLSPTEPDGKLSVHFLGTLADLLLTLGVKRKKGLSDEVEVVDNIDKLVLIAVVAAVIHLDSSGRFLIA